MQFSLERLGEGGEIVQCSLMAKALPWDVGYPGSRSCSAWFRVIWDEKLCSESDTEQGLEPGSPTLQASALLTRMHTCVLMWTQTFWHNSVLDQLSKRSFYCSEEQNSFWNLGSLGLSSHRASISWVYYGLLPSSVIQQTYSFAEVPTTNWLSPLIFCKNSCATIQAGAITRDHHKLLQLWSVVPN